MQNFLEVTLALADEEHGFRQRRSCLSQLLNHYDEILRGLEEGHNVDTIFLELSKAFDIVDKFILCWKIRRMGVFRKLGIWIHNFLSERVKVVLANGARSSEARGTSGIPQGTVLMMINDLPQCVTHSSVSKLADDTRVTKVIKAELLSMEKPQPSIISLSKTKWNRYY